MFRYKYAFASAICELSALCVDCIFWLTCCCFCFFPFDIFQPPKIQKSKAAKMLAAQSSGKSKGKKKKWAKSKLREKKQHAVVFNKALFDKFLSEVPKKTVITIYSLVENYKISGSLARRGIILVNTIVDSISFPLFLVALYHHFAFSLVVFSCGPFRICSIHCTFLSLFILFLL